MGNVFFDFFEKLKIKRNLKYLFSFDQVQKCLPILGPKKCKPFFFLELSCWRLFSEVIVSVILIIENFAASAQPNSVIFFGIELLKMYLIGSNVPVFEHGKIVPNHSTLLHTHSNIRALNIQVYSTTSAAPGRIRTFWAEP